MTTMTLSITPFQNDQEVRKFLDLAYSDDVKDKKEAINKINELEARISQLPMGLGSLKHILKVEIIRAEQQNTNDENGALQYACAVAVLKFVDAVSVPYRAHHSRLSYRNIAKQVDLPGHIISLRHDIAHHHELPSLHDLLAAVDFSKTWLRKNCLEELVETMALFSQGSYSELLEIIARETVQAYVDARANFLVKRSKKRLQVVDERVEEIQKALQMSNGKEIMAEVLVRCGNLIMIPKQLARLDYDSESTDHLPTCVVQFWKPILPLIQTDNTLSALIVDKILEFLTDYHCLTSSDPSIIDRQRIGWIFHLIEQPSTKLDLCSIFLRLVRILQPWFAESLSQMIVQMADDMNGTRKVFIDEQKRDTLLRTISMFANPFDNLNDEQPTTTEDLSQPVISRRQLYEKELQMFQMRTKVAEIPAGLLNDEDEQNLEMNIDLSKTDRNFLGCTSKRKDLDPSPTKRIRTSSPTIDSNLFHDLLYPRHHFRY